MISRLLISQSKFHKGYYKYLYPDKLICGVQFWFTVHRSVMIITVILSIVAFILALAFKEWSWINPEDPSTHLVHSIFGIIAIGVAFFQVEFF